MKTQFLPIDGFTPNPAFSEVAILPVVVACQVEALAPSVEAVKP